MYYSQGKTNLTTNQRNPSNSCTANSFNPVKFPSRMSSVRTSTPDDDAASTLSAPFINPKHPPEICPPSPHSSKREKWRKLKEENKARKSREVTKISCNEAAALTGRDQRGFKVGEDDKWMQGQKDIDAKMLWECTIM